MMQPLQDFCSGFLSQPRVNQPAVSVHDPVSAVCTPRFTAEQKFFCKTGRIASGEADREYPL